MNYGTILAVDEIGNDYEKQVSMDTIDNVLVVSVGSSNYQFNDLIKPKPNNFGDRFYLDIRGKNKPHKGHAVWCSNDELIKLITGRK